MFVPRCCEQTCNLRAYSKDADFLMLAERRAAFFSDIGGGASIVNDADSVTIKAEAGYVWVGYMTPAGTITGQHVAVARYTDDLSEEQLYLEASTNVGTYYNVPGSGFYPSSLLGQDADSGFYQWLWGVDEQGNLSYCTGRDKAVKSYSPDGSLRWQVTVANLQPGTVLRARIHGVGVADDGSVWILYKTEPTGTFPVLPTRFWCAKYNSSGTLQFALELLPPTISGVVGTVGINDDWEIQIRNNTPVVRTFYQVLTTPIATAGYRFYVLPGAGGGAIQTADIDRMGEDYGDETSQSFYRRMIFPSRNKGGANDMFILRTSTDWQARSSRRIHKYNSQFDRLGNFSCVEPNIIAEPANPSFAASATEVYDRSQFYATDGRGTTQALSGTERMIVGGSIISPGTRIPRSSTTVISYGAGFSVEWESDPINQLYRDDFEPDLPASALHIATNADTVYVVSQGPAW